MSSTAEISPSVSQNLNIWGPNRQPAHCTHCAKISLVRSTRLGKLCPWCSIGTLESIPSLLYANLPELIVGFQINASKLHNIFSGFISGVWLRPKDFNLTNLMSHITPIFIPVWLVDTDIIGSWTAEVGFDYQVKSVQEYFTNGQWQTRELFENRVRWEQRRGEVNKRYNNIIVTALNEHNSIINNIGDFIFDNAVTLDQRILGTSDILSPDLDPVNGFENAAIILNKAAERDCQKASGAGYIRNYSIIASYEKQNWTQLLLPLYSTFYLDDEGVPQRILINGQTGTISGKRLASQKEGWKLAGIIGFVAALLLVIGFLGLLFGAAIPPLILFGGVLITISIIIGLFAFLPIIYPWQWNRRQRNF